MTITLPLDLEQRVREQAKQAGFGSPDEFVREILRAYFADDEETRRAMEEAEEQFGRGEGISLEEFDREMRAKF